MSSDQRRSRRSAAAVATTAAAIALCAIAGCGSAAKKPAAIHPLPLVAWSSVVPAALRAPAAGAPTACRASQLRVAGAGLDFQSTVSGASGSVQVRNVGDQACRLTGPERVRFFGAKRAPAQRQVAEPALAPEFPSISKPAASLLALAPGAAATLSLDWSNWCVPGPRSATPVAPPTAVRVTLPAGGGSIDIPYNAVTSCEQPGKPSTIGVHPFQAEVLASGNPWSRVLLTARVLTVAGAPPPLHARRGTVLRFSVVLRNASNQTLKFDDCPLFAQELAPSGGVEAHMLNCARAHAVAPGHAIRFAMLLNVPSNSPLGVNGLFWVLDPLGAQGPEATARVIVAPR